MIKILLIDKARELKTGDKVTLVIKAIGGESYNKVTISQDGIEQKGFITPCAAWSCFQSEGDKPCYQIIARPYRKKTDYVYRLEYNVIDIINEW